MHMTSLFSGLTFCAECSTSERPVPMNVCSSQRRSNGKKYVYLRCVAKETDSNRVGISTSAQLRLQGVRESVLAHVSEIDVSRVLGDKKRTPPYGRLRLARPTAQHRLQTLIDEEQRLATRYDGETDEAKAEIILERLVKKRAEIAKSSRGSAPRARSSTTNASNSPKSPT